MNTEQQAALAQEAIAIEKAWSKLPRGHYSPREIERWIRDDLGPVVLRIREIQAYQQSEGKST